MKGTIIIAGIGTGGHFFPAAVVAREFQRRQRPVIFLVRPEGPEEKVARRYGLKTVTIAARGFYGKSLKDKLLSVWIFLRAVYRLLPVVQGGVGVAFGGFGSLPLLAACLIRRRPFYLFEANCVPGRATRIFAARARCIFLGLPLARNLPGHTILTGIPVRPEFKEQRTDFLAAANNPMVLVMGGSQGARRLNQLAVELKDLLPVSYRITIVSGTRDYDWMIKNQNGRTRVIAFTETPWKEFRAASVIVSRAGALAGYEILTQGRPAIFVPFPAAVDNHQWFNAQHFVRAGGGRLMPESDLNATQLARVIQELASSKPAPAPALNLDAESRMVDMILEEMSHAR